MSEIPYVSQESAELAQAWELRFQMLPAMAGVLFVSVSPIPALKGEVNSFEVRLGITRAFEEGTAKALIKKVLQTEIGSGKYNISASVYRGAQGAAAFNAPHVKAGGTQTQ